MILRTIPKLEGTHYETMQEVEEDRKFIVDRLVKCYGFDRSRVESEVDSANLTPQEVSKIVRGRVPIRVFREKFYVGSPF